jgi:uracil-DNA glycosylase
MADVLYEYLRFYRDLGFTDLYLPEGATGFIGLTGAAKAPTSDVPNSEPAAGVRGPGSILPATGPTPQEAAAKAPAPTAAARAGRPAAATDRPPPQRSGAADSTSATDRNPLPMLQSIQADIGDCTRCRLHEGRSKIVFGSGNPEARLVFVGEGPGADEDAQGLPFVGRAGQLLTQMINNTASGEGIPISRDDVYICNVVKCRPPGNRTPEPDEMETCGQFLTRQLDAIRPKAICLLGATAARYLLGTRLGITKLRGNWQDWHGIPVMPTYHPSFLLRPYAQDKKREAWEDLKKVLHYVYDSE